MNATEFYRERVFYTFSFVGIFSTITFGVITYISTEKYDYAVFEGFLVLIAFLNVIYYAKTKDYGTASSVILLLMITILSFLVSTGGNEGTGIFWIYTYPLLAFFLKSRKEALLWNIFLGIAILSLLILEHSGYLQVYYNYLELRQAFGSYIAVFLLAFFYNRTLERLIELMHTKSITDPLTGLNNRAFFLENLRKLIERLKRGNTSRHCVVYIDLDGFKGVNDRFGHSVGDGVLREAASIIKRNFREGDIVSRLGGDEFIVLAHDCTASKIIPKIDKLIKDIEKKFSEYNLSASYGIVELPEESLDLAEILKLADRRMYEMKTNKHRDKLN